MISVITYNLDSLDTASLRALVLEALQSKWERSGPRNSGNSYRADYSNICTSIAELAVKKGLIPAPHIPAFQPYTTKVSEKGAQKIGSILWSLVIQEVLYVDMSSSGLAFDITEYGLNVLSAGIYTPHDPDGYLKALKAEIPDIDDTIFKYVSESIQAYNHHLLLSATTAIGCASEKAILLLVDAYASYLPVKEQAKFRNHTSGKFIKTQFEEFEKSLNGHRADIERDLIDGIDITISGIFELLRQSRNSSGHPTGKALTREQTFGLLQVFAMYCKRIYDLKHFFESQSSEQSHVNGTETECPAR